MPTEDTLFVGKAASDVALVMKNNDGDLYRIETHDDGLIVTKNGRGTSFLTGFPAKRRVVAKTADYTCTLDDSGTLFTTTGAGGAVIFTLPATANGAGVWYDFFNTVDQNMTVTAGTADTMITANELDADSVAFSTSSEKIGGCIRVVGDGTYWLVMPFTAEGLSTITVAD
jgi:hypothetical protein